MRLVPIVLGILGACLVPVALRQVNQVADGRGRHTLTLSPEKEEVLLLALRPRELPDYPGKEEPVSKPPICSVIDADTSAMGKFWLPASGGIP